MHSRLAAVPAEFGSAANQKCLTITWRIVGKPEIEPIGRDWRYIAITLRIAVVSVNAC